MHLKMLSLVLIHLMVLSGAVTSGTFAVAEDGTKVIMQAEGWR